MGTNILTTQATDDDTLATEAGNPYPVHLVPASSFIGTVLKSRQDFAPAVALVAGASPQTISDAAYTSGPGAISERVSVAIVGSMDAQATVTAQLLRDGVAFGAQVSWFSDAGGNFGGSIDQISPTEPVNPAGHTHTFAIKLTSAGRTFNVNMGGAGFAISDLGG
jgi:hypothetical protein